MIHSICGFLSSGQMPLPRGVQIALSLVVMMTALAVGPTALAQPTAQPDSFTVQEDSSGNSFDVLANDSTPDTRTSVSVTTPNQGGSVNIVGGGPDNTLSYVPAGNFFGTERFNYTMQDSGGGSSSAQVTVTVDPLPDPTTAQNDNYSTNEDSTLNRNASQGVLNNDSDPDGN